MSEPGLKCEYNASFKQIFTLKLFIAFEMVYSCCFSFGGNQDFPEFLQKKFYNINYWSVILCIWIGSLKSLTKSILCGLGGYGFGMVNKISIRYLPWLQQEKLRWFGRWPCRYWGLKSKLATRWKTIINPLSLTTL